MALHSENLRAVFADEGKYNGFQKLMSDLVQKNEMFEYDEETGAKRAISRKDANNSVRKVFCEICGLSDEEARKNAKKRKRAIGQHIYEICEVIEDVANNKIQYNLLNSEWLDTVADYRVVSVGDSLEFTVGSNALFAVCDYSGANHDVALQQLNEGEVVMVKPTPKVIKIGKDIDLIISGRIDFDTWIERVADSFEAYVQSVAYDTIVASAEALPSDFVITGAMDASSKDNFDELIERVSAANGGADVVLVGTGLALKKINGIADVDWASESLKENLARTGIIGSYEGTAMLRIPQRLQYGDTKFEYDNNKIFIVPVVDDKFVKIVDEGDVEIFEANEKGMLADDFQTYEMVRNIGVGVAVGNNFGQWVIESN